MAPRIGLSQARALPDEDASLDPRLIYIFAKRPRISMALEMGDGAATLTDGLGGWGTVERVDDIALTDWQGQAPLQQTIPIMLDGYSEDRSVERELHTLLKLGRDAAGDENIPPVFTVKGPIYFPHLRWVLPSGGIELDPSSVIRSENGVLLRQALTLNLLEYVPPEVVKLRKGRGSGFRHNEPLPVPTYTVKQGDTLVKIAAKVYGDWQRWPELGKKNDIKNPHTKLKPGRVLRIS